MTKNKPKNESERRKDLRTAREILKKLEGRIKSERFRVYETDPLFLKFVRVYSQHLAVVNQIEKDCENEELEERIEALEQAKDGAPMSLYYPDEGEEDAGKR